MTDIEPHAPIYLDYKATTPVDSTVVEAMSPYWNVDFGNPHSQHAAGWRAEHAIGEARDSVARLIGAMPEEIVFTSGATEANNLAILGLLQHEVAGGRNVVVSAIEHKCVLEASRQLERMGYSVRRTPVDGSGHVDLEVLFGLIDANTALVSVMLVNNELGTIQPIKEISRRCREVGAVFHCDAAQATTAIAIDVEDLGVDLMSLSAHKMYGPKGVGALFVSGGVRSRLRPLIHGGAQEDGIRSGTLPTPLCVGFGAAARLVLERRQSDVLHLAACRGVFLKTLAAGVPDLVVNGDEPKHPGHLNVRLPGVDAANLIANVQPRLALSTGSACSSGIPEPSHVLRAMGLDSVAAGQSIRVGFGRLVDEGQARQAARILSEEIVSLRQFSAV